MNPHQTMIKKIIILGHSGFIGSHLERSLRMNYPALNIVGKSLPAFNLIEDASLLKNYFDSDTAVIICAAVKKQWGDTTENCQKNLSMILNLCKVLEKYPVHRIIYLSSAEVYGHYDHQLITEETPVQPTSYYGIAKYAAERMLQKVMPHNLVILRPPQIYGPGDMPCYGPSGFLQAVRDGTKITLWGGGEEKREFIFVDDVVTLIQHLIFSDYSGVLNVASGVSYSYQEVLETIENKIKITLSITSQERTLPKIDFYFSGQKVKELFPAFEFTPLSEGIEKIDLGDHT